MNTKSHWSAICEFKDITVTSADLSSVRYKEPNRIHFVCAGFVGKSTTHMTDSVKRFHFLIELEPYTYLSENPTLGKRIKI